MFSKCCNEPIIDGICMGCGEQCEVIDIDEQVEEDET